MAKTKKMKKRSILLSILFLLGCSNKNSNFVEIKDKVNKLKIYYSNKDSTNVFVDSILYTNSIRNGKIINLKSRDIIISKDALNDIISTNTDYNFNGYNDIEIYRPDLSGYNSLSNHFLYRKTDAKFIENKSLDSIYNIVLLPKRKNYVQNGEQVWKVIL